MRRVLVAAILVVAAALAFTALLWPGDSTAGVAEVRAGAQPGLVELLSRGAALSYEANYTIEMIMRMDIMGRDASIGVRGWFVVGQDGEERRYLLGNLRMSLGDANLDEVVVKMRAVGYGDYASVEVCVEDGGCTVFEDPDEAGITGVTVTEALNTLVALIGASNITVRKLGTCSVAGIDGFRYRIVGSTDLGELADVLGVAGVVGRVPSDMVVHLDYDTCVSEMGMPLSVSASVRVVEEEGSGVGFGMEIKSVLTRVGDFNEQLFAELANRLGTRLSG